MEKAIWKSKLPFLSFNAFIGAIFGALSQTGTNVYPMKLQGVIETMDHLKVIAYRFRWRYRALELRLSK